MTPKVKTPTKEEAPVRAKTPEDFKLDTPSSLREFLVGQLEDVNQERLHRGKPAERYDDAGIADLMRRLYAHIEQESLKEYNSNEPWAIKNWVVNNILGKPIVDEESFGVAEGYAEPVTRWQNESTDPIQNFRVKLEASRKKPGYIREVMRPAIWFVADNGRKERYTEREILQFIRKLALRYDKRDDHGKVVKRGQDTSTYVTKMAQFKVFLQSLPEDEVTGRKQTIPFDLPSMPDSFEQPTFSNDEVADIIYTAIMEAKPEIVLRMVLATVYGCRCGEIAEMDSTAINLDTMTVNVPTEKKGARKPQPIPESLKPIFSVRLRKTTKQAVILQLKAICRKAGIVLPKRTGVHAIRRAVVTSLYSNTNLKEISIRRFMRWSMPRSMGSMPTYVKTPADITDNQVLEVHPFLRIWEDLTCFIPYLPQWERESLNVQLLKIYYI